MAKKRQKQIPAGNRIGARQKEVEASASPESRPENQSESGASYDISQVVPGFDSNLYLNLDEASKRNLWEKHKISKKAVSETSLSRRANFEDEVSAEDGVLLREIEKNNPKLYENIIGLQALNPDKARQLMDLYLIEKQNEEIEKENLSHGLGELLRNTTGMKVDDEEIKARISQASQKIYASPNEEVINVPEDESGERAELSEQPIRGLTKILKMPAETISLPEEIMPLPVEEAPALASGESSDIIPAGIPIEEIPSQVKSESEPFVVEPVAEQIPAAETPSDVSKQNGKKSRSKSGKSARLTIADALEQVAELKNYTTEKDAEIYRDMATQLKLLETSLRQDLQAPLHDAARNADEAARQREESGKILQNLEEKIKEIPVTPEQIEELRKNLEGIRNEYFSYKGYRDEQAGNLDERIGKVEKSALSYEKRQKGTRHFNKMLSAATLAGSAIIAYLAGSCGRGCGEDEKTQIPQVQRAELEQIVKEAAEDVKLYINEKVDLVAAEAKAYADNNQNLLEEKIEERLKPTESKIEELSKGLDEIKSSYPSVAGAPPQETESRDPVVERVEPQETGNSVVQEVAATGNWRVSAFAEGVVNVPVSGEVDDIGYGVRIGEKFVHEKSGLGAEVSVYGLSTEDHQIAPFGTADWRRIELGVGLAGTYSLELNDWLSLGGKIGFETELKRDDYDIFINNKDLSRTDSELSVYGTAGLDVNVKINDKLQIKGGVDVRTDREGTDIQGGAGLEYKF